MITNWKHIAPEDIQLYKPECTGPKRYILRSEYKNDECFIQVPLSMIYRCDIHTKLSIGFPNVCDVPDKLEFVKKMEKIDRELNDEHSIYGMNYILLRKSYRLKRRFAKRQPMSPKPHLHCRTRQSDGCPLFVGIRHTRPHIVP